jgi:hypothetical protein
LDPVEAYRISLRLARPAREPSFKADSEKRTVEGPKAEARQGSNDVQTPAAPPENERNRAGHILFALFLGLKYHHSFWAGTREKEWRLDERTSEKPL